VGRGFEAGISIVFMAIIIDRITHAFAEHEYESQGKAGE
jgi:ABC-type proline/glycine betaine transport system permease subunit